MGALDWAQMWRRVNRTSLFSQVCEKGERLCKIKRTQSLCTTILARAVVKVLKIQGELLLPNRTGHDNWQWGRGVSVNNITVLESNLGCRYIKYSDIQDLIPECYSNFDVRSAVPKWCDIDNIPTFPKAPTGDLCSFRNKLAVLPACCWFSMGTKACCVVLLACVRLPGNRKACVPDAYPIQTFLGWVAQITPTYTFYRW